MKQDYFFGSRSNQVKQTLHKDLKRILELAIKRTYVDFGLHEGARTIETQKEYFKNGKSRINPDIYVSNYDLCKLAKHIVIPGDREFNKSRAVDLHVSESYKGKKLTWDKAHLCYIAGIIQSCAQELYKTGEVSHLVRWGGDWNMNGVISLDQSLDDLVHFELYKP